MWKYDNTIIDSHSYFREHLVHGSNICIHNYERQTINVMIEDNPKRFLRLTAGKSVDCFSESNPKHEYGSFVNNNNVSD